MILNKKEKKITSKFEKAFENEDTKTMLRINREHEQEMKLFILNMIKEGIETEDQDQFLIVVDEQKRTVKMTKKTS